MSTRSGYVRAMPHRAASDFEMSLALALRAVRQQARLDFAARHPLERDAGADAIAKQVLAHLSLSRWTFTPGTGVAPHGLGK